jgi:uncharacterized membrane protein YagU involved in acid resistance
MCALHLGTPFAFQLHMQANRFLSGAVAGFAATVPMTAVMLTLHRGALPVHHRYPLPPRRITMRVAGKARVWHRLDENDRTAATYAAHFGYGTATGAVYGALAPRLPGNPLLKGASYGLLVWALSYLGLLPALDLHRPATREPAERNALMILAHVVWGATLGVLTPQISRSTQVRTRRRSDIRRLRPVGAR